MIFDDADAARIVRKGSRFQDEEKFAAARNHQKATYLKNAATGAHSFIVDLDPPEVVEY